MAIHQIVMLFITSSEYIKITPTVYLYLLFAYLSIIRRYSITCLIKKLYMYNSGSRSI